MSVSIVSIVKNVTSVYLAWILLHYISSHLYVHLCVPATIIGFLASPFMTPLPHCIAFRWVIYNGGKMIEVMWIFIGKWAIEKLIFVKKEDI